MKNSTLRRNSNAQAAEKESTRLLMEKMGMSRKEIQEVKNNYGVSAMKLVELMQLSKYQFIHTGKVDGQCEPCFTKMGRVA